MIEIEEQTPVPEQRVLRRTPRQLARAVEDGRQIAEALRLLHLHGDEPDAPIVADALARFFVARCESHHAGWRVLRQVIVDSNAEAPWERTARRAIPHVADDLVTLAAEGGFIPLSRAQHVAAERRVEELAPHLDPAALLADLDLAPRAVTPEQWEAALVAAVTARSREQVARKLDRALGG